MKPQTKPMVQAEQVCKNFGALKVLKGVTLEVGKGQVLVLVGPSGSGKSTFLRCINHLEKVNAGRLYVDGDLIGYRERGTSCTRCRPATPPSSAATSAWCSSTSTSSRTARRWRTSSRRRST